MVNPGKIFRFKPFYFLQGFVYISCIFYLTFYCIFYFFFLMSYYGYGYCVGRSSYSFYAFSRQKKILYLRIVTYVCTQYKRLLCNLV